MNAAVLPLSDIISSELDRLEISTDHDPYSGLLVECESDALVKVFDDYDSAIVDGGDFLSLLKELPSTSLEDVWAFLSSVEVSSED